MGKRPLLLVSLFSVVVPIAAWAQAAVEYGMGAASSAARTSHAASTLNQATRRLADRTAASMANTTTSSNAPANNQSSPQRTARQARPAATPQQPAQAAAPRQPSAPVVGLDSAGGLAISSQTTAASQKTDKYQRAINLSFGK